jgi:hypothetical protein
MPSITRSDYHSKPLAYSVDKHPDESERCSTEAMQLDQGAFIMTRSTTDNSKALNAFLAAKHEIDGMLERLATFSADHFETSPDEIHWGHVGTLNHYRAKLREITDSAFKEGEHAE